MDSIIGFNTPIRCSAPEKHQRSIEIMPVRRLQASHQFDVETFGTAHFGVTYASQLPKETMSGPQHPACA